MLLFTSNGAAEAPTEQTYVTFYIQLLVRGTNRANVCYFLHPMARPRHLPSKRVLNSTSNGAAEAPTEQTCVKFYIQRRGRGTNRANLCYFLHPTARPRHQRSIRAQHAAQTKAFRQTALVRRGGRLLCRLDRQSALNPRRGRLLSRRGPQTSLTDDAASLQRSPPAWRELQP